MSARGTRVIQIVPRLTPFDGVGDYALRLAEALQQRHGVVSNFIEAGTRSAAATSGAFESRRSAAGSGSALAAALAEAGAGQGVHVLLHYVGYGYARRGAPFWLERAVARTRASLHYRLGVVFHELYAGGRPWQSAFWLGALQKIVARALARECDGALLWRGANRQWLEHAETLAGKPVEVLPVPSSVGEPERIAPVAQRRLALVVWGSAAMKDSVYGRHLPALRDACQALGITRIEDVGAPASGYPQVAGIHIERHGLLPARDLCRVFGETRFGMVVYPASFLAKSTQFAAYAAHGLVPLVLDEPSSTAMDGLSAGRHFLWLAGLVAPPPRVLDEVAAAARAWYEGHTVARHADAVSRIFEERPS